jgi:hypothetical protein
MDRLLLVPFRVEKDLQRIPGATAEIGKEFPVVKEISAQDLRDADTLKGTSDEMPVGNFLFNTSMQSRSPNSTTCVSDDRMGRNACVCRRMPGDIHVYPSGYRRNLCISPGQSRCAGRRNQDNGK